MDSFIIGVKPSVLDKKEIIGVVIATILFLAIGIYFSSGKLMAIAAVIVVFVAVSSYLFNRNAIMVSKIPTLVPTAIPQNQQL